MTVEHGLPEPYVYCGYGIDVPQGFLKYIDVRQLLLHSKARKSPLVWKTIAHLIRENKQKNSYAPLILKASKDTDEWVRRVASEAMEDLDLEK